MLHVRRLTSTAQLPSRAHPYDAGLDLFADESTVIPPLGRALVKTGLSMAIDPGKVGLIWPRSGLAVKGISTDAGVIDSGYRGEVSVLLTNTTQEPYPVQVGDKIAQMILQGAYPDVVKEVDELLPSSRGTDGFGSTG